MKVVKGYVALKKRLGGIGRFEFEAQNPAQAIKALCANLQIVRIHLGRSWMAWGRNLM